MAAPLLASLALISSALPSPAPLEQLFQDQKIELQSLSLADKDSGLKTPAPPANLPLFGRAEPSPLRKKRPEMRGLMPIIKPELLDPKFVHAPADTDTDFKLIVKEVRIANEK